MLPPRAPSYNKYMYKMYNCTFKYIFLLLLKLLKETILLEPCQIFLSCQCIRYIHPLTPMANIHFTLYHQFHTRPRTLHTGFLKQKLNSMFNDFFNSSINRFVVHGNILWRCEAWNPNKKLLKILTLQFWKIWPKYTRNLLKYLLNNLVN